MTCADQTDTSRERLLVILADWCGMYANPHSFIWPEAQGPHCYWHFSSVQHLHGNGEEVDVFDAEMSRLLSKVKTDFSVIRYSMLCVLVSKSMSSLSSLCYPVAALQSWVFWPQFQWLMSPVHASLMSSKFTQKYTLISIIALYLCIFYFAFHLFKVFAKRTFLNEDKDFFKKLWRTFFSNIKVKYFCKME